MPVLKPRGEVAEEREGVTKSFRDLAQVLRDATPSARRIAKPFAAGRKLESIPTDCMPPTNQRPTTTRYVESAEIADRVVDLCRPDSRSAVKLHAADWSANKYSKPSWSGLCGVFQATVVFASPRLLPDCVPVDGPYMPWRFQVRLSEDVKIASKIFFKRSRHSFPCPSRCSGLTSHRRTC
jgi:hypothetical protein